MEAHEMVKPRCVELEFTSDEILELEELANYQAQC